ncbi:hypothetical protein GBAR_LOCUS9785 [Geodia barretti]|uniref:Uncharacterized protein n=1 Tax=Geodia barretti TaxID=519541 RepID=A0AA35RQH5_GEOBA|nr:hypothetical protein GBAR_LOCUS9785 [Geodia barretti]
MESSLLVSTSPSHPPAPKKVQSWVLGSATRQTQLCVLLSSGWSHRRPWARNIPTSTHSVRLFMLVACCRVKTLLL